jgi:hypothetical protein
VHVHEGYGLGANHSAQELGGCKSTSTTQCRLEVEDGTDGWVRLLVTMEEREMKLGGEKD